MEACGWPDLGLRPAASFAPGPLRSGPPAQRQPTTIPLAVRATARPILLAFNAISRSPGGAALQVALGSVEGARCAALTGNQGQNLLLWGNISCAGDRSPRSPVRGRGFFRAWCRDCLGWAVGESSLPGLAGQGPLGPRAPAGGPPPG